MEGGVRQSRASSRNAAAATPTSPAFNGPVRKWKKQWVTVSPSPAISTYRTPPLVLCRWVPLSDIPDDTATDQPPARRFRYVPVAPLDKNKQKVIVSEGRLIIRNQSNNGAHMSGNESDFMLEKPAAEDISIEEAEEPSEEDEADSEKSDGEGNPFAKKRKVSPTGKEIMLN